ncbi:MAG: acyl carrier protein [Tissierellia bacterium]|nr:acyl carrier protein [Tissierellia bacterium]
MEIREKIIEIIQNINEDFDPNEESDIIEDGILDSFDIINFIMEANESFGVKISVEEIVPENFTNVESIQKLIERLKNN